MVTRCVCVCNCDCVVVVFVCGSERVSESEIRESVYRHCQKIRLINWFWLPIFRTNRVRALSIEEMKFQKKGAVAVQIAPWWISQPDIQNESKNWTTRENCKADFRKLRSFSLSRTHTHTLWNRTTVWLTRCSGWPTLPRALKSRSRASRRLRCVKEIFQLWHYFFWADFP